MSLSSNTIHKLAFVKYLKALSDEQGKKSSPLSSASVLILHDAIDVFLQEAFDFLKLEKRKGRDGKLKIYYLSDYADDIHSFLIKQGKDGLHKTFIEKINKSRNNLKHWTQFVAPVDVAALLLSAKSFLEENSLKIFNVKFSDISLIDIVPHEEIKQILKEAVSQKDMGENEEALGKIYEAHDKLLRILEHKYSSARSLFNTHALPTIDRLLRRGLSSPADKNTVNMVTSYSDQLSRWLRESFNDVFAMLRVMGIGIDLRKYMRFLQLRPSKGWVEVTMDCGEEKETVFSSKSPKESITEENWEFCLDFVIEFAFMIAS